MTDSLVDMFLGVLGLCAATPAIIGLAFHRRWRDDPTRREQMTQGWGGPRRLLVLALCGLAWTAIFWFLRPVSRF